ncbi:hypothetical protein Cni_G00814 [Canna indica]|uniref:Uncharacterized protein n=1 Tax=Canna indica TaxID=4628 RepID=A0AAQ3PXR6_9LILI|nr:hypothetical protein Cni_G00814 [Canna indica]
MRVGAGFNTTAAPAAARIGGHSGLQSPVSYLFGGLAAMLGLIAFALLLLACSYWKLSRRVDQRGRRDGSGGGGVEAKLEAAMASPLACYEEKIVVIMAGEERPRYLATPTSSRATSFGDHSASRDDDDTSN